MGQDHNNFTEGLEKALSALAPERVVRDWQLGAMRMLRAQERMMQGMMTAAKLEVRYSQELMASRMGMLDWESAKRGESSEHVTREFEKLSEMMREVMEELKGSFAEASKLLREGRILPELAEPVPVETVAAPAPEPEPVVEPVAVPVVEPVAEPVVEAAPAPVAVEPEAPAPEAPASEAPAPVVEPVVKAAPPAVRKPGPAKGPVAKAGPKPALRPRKTP